MAARSENGPGSSGRERVGHRSRASSDRRRGTVSEAEIIVRESGPRSKSPGENTGEQRWHHEKTPSSFRDEGVCCSQEVTDVPGAAAAVHAPGERAADPLLQHRGGSARAAPAAAPSGHPGADRPRRPGAALPDGADPPGGQLGAVHRDPRAGARRVPHLSAIPAHSSAGPGAGARHAGAHLLQERVGLARPAHTSRTPRSHRPTTTRPRASPAS